MLYGTAHIRIRFKEESRSEPDAGGLLSPPRRLNAFPARRISGLKRKKKKFEKNVILPPQRQRGVVGGWGVGWVGWGGC